MSDDWKASLPDELKNAPALADVKDIAGLAKRFLDTQAFVGASLRPPGPDASEQAKAEFRAKLKEKLPDLVEIPKDPAAFEKFEGDLFARLGRPADPNEYKPPADLPKDLEVPDEVVDALRLQAKEEGLTKKQFEARVKRAAQSLADSKKRETDALTALKKEFGDAFDERSAAAREVAVKLGVPKDAAEVMPPEQVRVWANVAKAIGGEAAPVGAQGAGASARLTPQEHRMRAAELRQRLANDNSIDYRDRRALIEKMVEHEEKAEAYA